MSEPIQPFFCFTYWGWISVIRYQRGPNIPLHMMPASLHHLDYVGLSRTFLVSGIPTAYAQIILFQPVFPDHVLLIQVFAHMFLLLGTSFPILSTGDSCLFLQTWLTHHLLPGSFPNLFSALHSYLISFLCSQCPPGGIICISLPAASIFC